VAHDEHEAHSEADVIAEPAHEQDSGENHS
jgi:hypothetical protein